MPRTGIKNKNPLHKWTQEELDFIRETFQTYDVNQTLIIFNERFKLDITKSQLKGIIDKYKIHCGRKGHVAHNKGKKWSEWMSKEGQNNCRKTTFKKGQLPQTTLPVGTEGFMKDGYVVVKMPTKTGTKGRPYWRLKHHLIWEAANGPIPKGYNVIFADGNKLNFDLDNLVLVSNQELMTMNAKKLIYKGNADATKCGVTLSKLMIRGKELAKK